MFIFNKIEKKKKIQSSSLFFIYVAAGFRCWDNSSSQVTCGWSRITRWLSGPVQHVWSVRVPQWQVVPLQSWSLLYLQWEPRVLKSIASVDWYSCYNDLVGDLVQRSFDAEFSDGVQKHNFATIVTLKKTRGSTSFSGGESFRLSTLCTWKTSVSIPFSTIVCEG